MYLAALQYYETNNDENSYVLIVGMCIVLAFFIYKFIRTRKGESHEIARRASLTKEELEFENANLQFGFQNSTMVCPHCQTKGMIRTKRVEKKSGVSGGKATAAVLTGGVSLLATGLSRKEDLTQAHCEKCKNTWTF
jgi:hypothetical protein